MATPSHIPADPVKRMRSTLLIARGECPAALEQRGANPPGGLQPRKPHWDFALESASSGFRF